MEKENFSATERMTSQKEIILDYLKNNGVKGQPLGCG